MGGRGAWSIVDAGLRLEHMDCKPLARERQRRDDPDRPAAGDQDGEIHLRGHEFLESIITVGA
jgi:hypothetical protein